MSGGAPREAPEHLGGERVYEGPLFSVVHDRQRLPGGGEAERAIVVHPGAVAMLAMDHEGRLLLVGQYRHGPGRRMLEIPAGTREPDEPPEVTARRELREETGYDAGSLVRIGGAWMAPGFTSEYIDFYLATKLRHAPLEGGDEEDLSPPIAMTLAQLDAAIAEGGIDDAKTIVARHLYAVSVRRDANPFGDAGADPGGAAAD